jgi:hypothetical protein
MSTSSNEFLTSDELRLLTNRGSSELQVDALLQMGVKFELDRYSCPLVRYEDAKQYLRLSNKSFLQLVTSNIDMKNISK